MSAVENEELPGGLIRHTHFIAEGKITLNEVFSFFVIHKIETCKQILFPSEMFEMFLRLFYCFNTPLNNVKIILLRSFQPNYI